AQPPYYWPDVGYLARRPRRSPVPLHRPRRHSRCGARALRHRALRGGVSAAPARHQPAYRAAARSGSAARRSGPPQRRSEARGGGWRRRAAGSICRRTAVSAARHRPAAAQPRR
nr:hypothetical protein [Tanacetum cinerariifolium]